MRAIARPGRMREPEPDKQKARTRGVRAPEPASGNDQSGFGPSMEFSSTLPVRASTPTSWTALPLRISNE